MKQKWVFRALLVAMVVLLCMGVALPVAAEGQYTINDTDIVPIPDSYLYDYTINTLKEAPEKTTLTFNQPADLFIDGQDNLYVVDSKNNRLVKMKTDGTTLMILKEANGTKFSGPQGVFVAKNGDIYLADTGNARIVHMTADGTVIREYGKPDSPKLTDIETYTPTKITCTDAGVMYVLMGENIMCVDAQNTFRGFIGQTEIGFDFLEWLLRIVASDEQKKAMIKRTAASYNNLLIGSDGLIYATSRDQTEGQVKVLNSVGNNIYRKAGSNASSFKKFINKLLNGNVINKSFQFGETVKIDNKWYQPMLEDIAVDGQGIITVLDRQLCRIYQYDSSGNLLAVFGKSGTNQGEFAIPVSLAIDSVGNLYVLDGSYGNIQVFKPSAFIQLVQKATTAYNNGEYAKADELWQQVLAIDETYPLAHLGVGNTAYKAEEYETAMESYKFYNDRDLYSKAFAEQRYLFSKEYFFFIVLIVFALAAGVVFGVVWLSRRAARVLKAFEYHDLSHLKTGSGLWMSCSMLFHPVHTLEALRISRGRLTYSSGLIVLLATVVTRVISIYTVHYPFQDIELSNVNLVLEVVKYLLPFFSWLITTYLIGSQFGGESTVAELFTAYSSAMLPLAVITPIMTIFSHILCTQEKGLYAVVGYFSVLWMAYLMIRSLQVLNNFSVGHTILVAVISLLATILLWFIALLGYTLIFRIVQFVQDLIQEAMLASV